MKKIFVGTFFFCAVGIIICTDYLFCNQPNDNYNNYHAVIENIEFDSVQHKTIIIKEEWFQRPNKIRREIFTPGIGSMKKVFIYDGENHYSYFPLSGERTVYEESFDYTPSFYSYELSKQTLELINKQKPKVAAKEERLDGREVYIVSDRASENNQIINLKAWIDKETFLTLKWEKEVRNSEGEIIAQELCKYIEYDIKIPDSLFRIPAGYKIAKTDLKENFLRKPFTPRVNYQRLTDDRMQQILSQERELREIINKYPENAEAYAQLGNLILLKGEYKEAIKLLNKSLELNPKQKNVYISLSEVYFATGEVNESIKSMEKVIELAPNNAYNYYRLGQLYEKAGFLEKAVSVYKHALELQPDDLINDEGVTYRINGIRKKYFEAYTKAKKRLEQNN